MVFKPETWFLFIIKVSMCFLVKDVNTGDIGLLCQYVTSTAEQFQQQLKSIKRKLPPDTSVANLGLNNETSENLYQSYQHIGKVWKTLQDVVKNAVQAINASSGEINYISVGFLIIAIVFNVRFRERLNSGEDKRFSNQCERQSLRTG